MKRKLLGAGDYIEAAGPVVRLNHPVPVPPVDRPAASTGRTRPTLVELVDTYELERR